MQKRGGGGGVEGERVCIRRAIELQRAAAVRETGLASFRLRLLRANNSRSGEFRVTPLLKTNVTACEIVFGRPMYLLD